MRQRFLTRAAAGLLALAALPLAAQTPGQPVPVTPSAPAAFPAPATSSAPPTVISDVPALPVRALTLDQALTQALDNNTSVLLARQQVLKAQQLIAEANAGGLPQINVNFVDTLSTDKTFGTAGGGTNSTGTLPGGGNIPVIIDTGGGNATSVTGSGGGGTATGAGSTSTGSTASTAATSAATTNTTASNTTLGSGTSTTSKIRQSSAGLPPIMQQLSAAVNAPAQKALGSRDGTGTTTTTGTGQLPGNGSDFTGSSGHHNNYSAQVSVTQGIDIFNLVPAAEDVEHITRDFYVSDLRRIQNETALSVKDQYFNVLRDQEQVVVYQEQVAADQESVRVTQAEVTAGSVAQFDLLTAQTTLSAAQQQLSSAQDTLTLAQSNLNNLLGLSADQPLSLQVPALPPLNQTFDKTRLTQTAFANRPEIIQGTNNIKIANRLVKLAGVGLLPSLSLVGSGIYDGYTSGGSHDIASISAVVGIPLYDGGTTRAKVKEAQADLRSQQITLSQLQENVTIEVRQALANITDAQTRAGSAALGAQQAQEAYRLATVRYKNGIGTILDVVNAQAQLAQARSNLVNAQYDYQTALAQLTRAIGSR